ncbi:MAG TPA: group III truncated hemoglobin [Beijerinckiaceae bacterium]|nr:group III truncated hemoglobin [Beijerinckiaceae bacterium]
MDNPSTSPFRRRAAASGLTEPLLRSIVAAFYEKVRADPTLGPIFERAIGQDWEAHIEKICAFWLTATRLQAGYKGGDFLPAHFRFEGMDPRLLPRWLALFRETVAQMCPPQVGEALVDIAERMAQSLEVSFARREAGRGS